jgi:hypothetical protein
MNKFWRIGLVLLVAIVACSDKKAEQAASLKTEIEAQLAKAAGPDKKYLTYGDVTVTPGDGDAYNVTIDKVMLTAPDIEPIDFGKVAFKLTPDGDDIRKYSDVTIPAAYKIKNKGGDEFDVNINLDHSTGSWSKSLGRVLNADMALKSIDITEPSTGDSATALNVTYVVTSNDKGSGVIDQKAVANAKQIVFKSKDGNASATDVMASTEFDNWKVAEFIALQQQWQKALENPKPGEVLPLFAKMVATMKAFHSELSFGNLTASEGSTQMFSIGNIHLGFGADDLDQPKSKINLGLRYAGLAIPNLAQEAGAATAELIPTDFGLEIDANDVPVPAAMDIATQNLAGVNMADEGSMAGAGMMMAGALQQALIQAATKFSIKDGALKAPAINATFTGEGLADKSAAMGASGSLDIIIADLDGVIQKISAHSDDPSAQEIVGVLTALKGLSDHGTDSSGKPTDHFKVTLDAQGNALVNGKPFNPAGP